MAKSIKCCETPSVRVRVWVRASVRVSVRVRVRLRVRYFFCQV